jgi:hypothetical protein
MFKTIVSFSICINIEKKFFLSVKKIVYFVFFQPLLSHKINKEGLHSYQQTQCNWAQRRKHFSQMRAFERTIAYEKLVYSWKK